ncbi:hypothetical protein ABPG77_007819 [Micractinium sp. CCAP 211/92]
MRLPLSPVAAASGAGGSLQDFARKAGGLLRGLLRRIVLGRQAEKNWETALMDVDSKWRPVVMWILTFLVVAAVRKQVPYVGHFLASAAVEPWKAAAEAAFATAVYSCIFAMVRCTTMELALKL